MPRPSDSTSDLYDLVGPAARAMPRPGDAIPVLRPFSPQQRPVQVLDDDALRRRLTGTLAVLLRESSFVVDSVRVAQDAIDYALAVARTAEGDPLAERIGEVYGAEDLRRWLPTSPTPEELRARVVGLALVGFETADGLLAFPSWQFDAVDGRLAVRDDVTALWQQMSHGGWMTDLDLILWMRTRLRSLDEFRPVEWVRRHGPDEPRLVRAVARLRRRTA